jgi:hypothetical protein
MSVSPRKSEAALQSRIIKEIQSSGGWAIASVSPPLPVGAPDVIAAYGGVPLGLEVKTPGGQALSRIQYCYLQKMQKSGSLSAVIQSTKELRMLLKWLDGLD